jgi:hypothetical protein
MKARVSILVVSLAVGAAMAQEAAPKQQPEKKANSPSTSTMAPEMKTLTYKGTLVDMSCTAATSTPSAAASSANRAAADTSSNCPVKADSSQLGIKLDDGRVMKFDMVGNQRAQDELKNNKRWSKDLSANKPIRATVDGVISGEKLVVSSIH